MKHIHGGKAKNDKIDSNKIAKLTMNHMLPLSYIYPKELRNLRDLLRKRNFFVSKRTELINQIQIHSYQANIQDSGKITKTKTEENTISSRFEDLDLKLNIQANLNTIEFTDNTLKDMEKYILSRVKSVNPADLLILRTIRGIGDITALTILLEIGDLSRFRNHKEFASYCRSIKCSHESAGKKLGVGCSKIGNAHLKNVFGNASVLVPKYNDPIKSYLNRLEAKYGKMKSRGILAHKLGRTVYYMLKNKKAFDMKKFLNS